MATKKGSKKTEKKVEEAVVEEKVEILEGLYLLAHGEPRVVTSAIHSVTT